MAKRKNQHRVLILGGCATRGILNLHPERYHIAGYVVATSLISLTSPPIEVERSDIQLERPFDCRTVWFDFTKQFWQVLESVQIDYLLIDFLMERHNLLKANQHYVVNSQRCMESGIRERLPHRFDLVPRHHEDTHRLWERSCDAFIAQLKAHLEPQQIILHKTYWARVYRVKQCITPFGAQRLEAARKNNRILKRYYRYFEESLTGIRTLGWPETCYLGDESHPLGLSPFHYTESYYLDMSDQLGKIMDRPPGYRHRFRVPKRSRLWTAARPLLHLGRRRPESHSH